MPKLLKLCALILSIIMVFSACNSSGTSVENSNSPINTAHTENFVIPENIISEAEYRRKVDGLMSGEAYERVDKEYVGQLDELREELYNLIIYNQETPDFQGTAYYVSPDGNDQNDGTTPETAWATLDKANFYELNEGDAVLFERGGLWRGTLQLKSGVTYAAYGTGHKPKIFNSVDGTDIEWIESDIENVWVTKKAVGTEDVGSVVINDEKVLSMSSKIDSIKENSFFFAGYYSKNMPITRKLYIYCKEGNPAEIYDSIEISIKGSVANFADSKKENIFIHGLELSFGQDFLYGGPLTNITISYCSFRFSGGQLCSEGIRFGGGGGTGGACDGLHFDHCFIYQQFDAGVTTQSTGSGASVFKNFTATDCLFEKVEYPYEYFQHVTNEENITKSRFENIYFGYNLCYDTGGGFGDKRNRSACIVGNSDKQQAINCLIEKNIFDRSQAKSVIISAQDLSGNPSDENLFKLKSNLYVTSRTDKAFASVNGNSYLADQNGFADYLNDGYDADAFMRIIP